MIFNSWPEMGIVYITIVQFVSCTFHPCEYTYADNILLYMYPLSLSLSMRLV